MDSEQQRDASSHALPTNATQHTSEAGLTSCSYGERDATHMERSCTTESASPTLAEPSCHHPTWSAWRSSSMAARSATENQAQALKEEEEEEAKTEEEAGEHIDINMMANNAGETKQNEEDREMWTGRDAALRTAIAVRVTPSGAVHKSRRARHAAPSSCRGSEVKEGRAK